MHVRCVFNGAFCRGNGAQGYHDDACTLLRSAHFEGNESDIGGTNYARPYPLSDNFNQFDQSLIKFD